MIDIHCHLLPGFAGGPRDIEASVQMALSADARGVQALVATPRYEDAEFRPQMLRAQALGDELCTRLRARGSLIDIQVSGEYPVGQHLARGVVMNHVAFIGKYSGFKVILLDLPTKMPGKFLSAIEWLRKHEIRPLLARPESHRDVLADARILKPLRTAGALIMINAAALAGRHGPYAQRRMREMLELGWGCAMSSDAQAGESIGALLEVGREAAAVVVGDDAAWDLVWKRPARIAAPHLLGKDRV